jgi:hypothetical protein
VEPFFSFWKKKKRQNNIGVGPIITEENGGVRIRCSNTCIGTETSPNLVSASEIINDGERVERKEKKNNNVEFYLEFILN